MLWSHLRRWCTCFLLGQSSKGRWLLTNKWRPRQLNFRPLTSHSLERRFPLAVVFQNLHLFPCPPSPTLGSARFKTVSSPRSLPYPSRCSR